MVFQSLFIFLFFFSRVSQIPRLEVGARLVLSRIQSAAPSQQSEDKNDKKKGMRAPPNWKRYWDLIHSIKTVIEILLDVQSQNMYISSIVSRIKCVEKHILAIQSSQKIVKLCFKWFIFEIYFIQRNSNIQIVYQEKNVKLCFVWFILEMYYGFEFSQWKKYIFEISRFTSLPKRYFKSFISFWFNYLLFKMFCHFQPGVSPLWVRLFWP